MKKLIAFLTIAGLLIFGASNFIYAQTDEKTDENTAIENTDTAGVQPADAAIAPVDESLVDDEEVVETKTFHQILKEKFIEGGAGFMGIVLLCLILGLALSIERIIYLNLSTTNTKKLLSKIETAIETDGVDAAQEICKTTKGPVASIFYQGLSKYNDGLEMVEKSIIAYGSVLMGRLEKGVSWISLFIAIAPMLGFMGTVIGMIQAFDNIEAMGDISATIVAGGIKVALLTTVFGLIVAIILQVFYNYIIAKIDSLVNDMEDSTITFVDILAKKK